MPDGSPNDMNGMKAAPADLGARAVMLTLDVLAYAVLTALGLILGVILGIFVGVATGLITTIC